MIFVKVSDRSMYYVLFLRIIIVPGLGKLRPQ
jgi:hypothetical protein